MESSAMRIAWYSRHAPLPSQVAELERLAGGPVEVLNEGRMFGPAEDLALRYRQSGCDDLVVVAPLSVIAVLCQQGLHPLWAEMGRVSADRAEVTMPGRPPRHFRFRGFRRIRELRMVFDDEVVVGHPES